MMKQVQRLRPGAPTLLTLGSATDTTQPLSWTAPAFAGGSSITGYDIYVSTDCIDFTFFDNVVGTSGTVTGLTSGETYWYHVRTKNAFGASTPSNVVTGATSAGPTTLMLDTMGDEGSFNGTCDSGQTRTVVAGAFAMTPGQLVWADDGSATSPSVGKYGSIAASGVITINGVVVDSSISRIYFCCDTTLQNGWIYEMDSLSQYTLYRIDSGVETPVAFSVAAGYGTVTSVITISGGNVSIAITYTGGGGGSDSIASTPLAPFASQTVVGVGLGTDGDGGSSTFTSVQLVG